MNPSVKDAELYMNDNDIKLMSEFKSDFIKLTKLDGEKAQFLAKQMV